MDLTEHVGRTLPERTDDDDLDRAMQDGFARCRQVENPEAAYRIGFADGLAWGIHRLIGTTERGREGVLIGSFDAFAADTCRSVHPRYGVLCTRDRHEDDNHHTLVQNVVSHW